MNRVLLCVRACSVGRRRACALRRRVRVDGEGGFNVLRTRTSPPLSNSTHTHPHPPTPPHSTDHDFHAWRDRWRVSSSTSPRHHQMYNTLGDRPAPNREQSHLRGCKHTCAHRREIQNKRNFIVTCPHTKTREQHAYVSHHTPTCFRAQANGGCE